MPKDMNWKRQLLFDISELVPEIGALPSTSGEGLSNFPTLHLAIFSAPYLDLLLEGRKTLESRFSKIRNAPYGQISPGDVVLLKHSGGSIVAVGRVQSAECITLDPEKIQDIRRRYAAPLCAESSVFWKQRSTSRFLTLLRFNDITRLPPLKCSKTDRMGWVVL